MKAKTFKITPDGDIYSLYDESLEDLYKTSNLKVFRASNVLFDDDIQKWYVELNMIDGTKKRLSETFVKRSDAIEYEIEVLNGILVKCIPVEYFFRTQ